LAQLVTSLVASTKLINAGPVSTWMGDRLQAGKPSRSTQPGHPSVGRCNEYQRKMGRKQARHEMHEPHIHGLAV